MHFYSHPDNVEFYPGILVEQTKSNRPGWLPGSTIARAVFCDALSLLRGDRFYSQVLSPSLAYQKEYSPATLTQWGYTFATSDPTVADGRVMYKLLMRAFPKWYTFNSIYAFFPFTVPAQTGSNLKDRDLLSTYSLDPPKPPATNIHFIEGYDACAKILGDPDTFKIWWGPAIKGLTGGVYMLSGDTKETTDQHKNLYKNVYCPGSTKAMWDFWTATMEDLVKAKAFKVGDCLEVDIVREYIPSPLSSFDILCPKDITFVPATGLKVVLPISRLRDFGLECSTSPSRLSELPTASSRKNNYLKVSASSLPTYSSMATKPLGCG